jgi:DNA segregation ATPase FtsK/SpoIIIE-like protein
MTKGIESRMLLGACGAEHLLGKGDLMFKDIGDPVRLQAAYLSDEEREGVLAAGVLTGAEALC